MRSRVAGITVLILSCLALVAAVMLSVFGHESPVIQIIQFVVSIPGLYIGWITYRGDSLEREKSGLSSVADDLADTVQHQWETEARLRGVSDNDVLSVSWDPAPEDLVESWDYLQKTALAAAAGDVGRQVRQQRGPGQLRGAGRGVVRVLRRVPNGRLVVLGEPGSGKSVLLIHLLLGLMREREHGSAVPVIVQLASWNPSEQNLRPWLVSQLTLDYPDLKNRWRSSTRSCTLAEALIDKHLLLILDGLDEIPVEVRDAAISKINDFLVSGMGVVISCRTDDYGKALLASGTAGRPMKLHGAAGICLRPLSDDDIRDYLLGDARAESAHAQRWASVLRSLSTADPVALAMRTPLMVGLARAVYNPLPGEIADPTELGSPDDLCDTARFGKQADVESYLCQAFIRSAYRARDIPKKNRWDSARAEKWLSFLAHHLQDKAQGTNRIAWWEFRDAGPVGLVPAVVGIICGLAAGLAAGFGEHVGFGIGVGLGTGAFVGLAGGILARYFSVNKGRPSEGIAGALIGGITGGLLGGLAGKLGIGHAVWPFGGLAVALAIAIGVGSSTTFSGGLIGALAGGFLAAVLEGVGKGLPAGLVNGAGMGFCAAMAARNVGRKTPAYRLYWSPLGALCGLAIGLIADRAAGLGAGVVLGIVVGLLSALPCGLSARPDQARDRLTVLSPRRSLRHDYLTFWKTAPPAGLAAGLAGLAGGGLVAISAIKGRPDLGNVLADGVWIGVAAGVIIGLGFGLHHAASVFFVITRCWLALRRKLPWRLMDFLADAHEERRILRQAGSVYEFRHDALMQWLASQNPMEAPYAHARPVLRAGLLGRSR